MLCMALFAHLREGFVGVHPNMALFRHYFIPRSQTGGGITSCITWIPRAQGKGVYPEGFTKDKWEEWWGRWCWIKEKDPQEFC